MIRSSFEYVETLWTDVNSAPNTVTPLQWQQKEKFQEKKSTLYIAFHFIISDKWIKISMKIKFKSTEIVLKVLSIQGVLCFSSRQRQFVLILSLML